MRHRCIDKTVKEALRKVLVQKDAIAALGAEKTGATLSFEVAM